MNRQLSSRAWVAEARALVALALPLVIGNLAWSLIAATDLLLLGRLGPDAVAAGALAINLYNGFLVFGMGLGTAVSPMIARERGRKAHSVREIRRTVRQSIWTIATICIPTWAILWHTEAILLAMDQDPGLSAKAALLMRGLQWALLPYLCFFVLRNYVAALERPMSGVIIVVAALPVNFVLGWCLIFGHMGAPAMGLFGAGIASSLSSLFMALSIVAVILLDRQFRRYHLLGRFWAADWTRYRHVWKLGLPIAITLALEVTVFNAATFLMGILGRAPLAAHAIAIQIAALCFMVPMGIGQAATIRVGLRFGQGDRAGIARAGWSALMLGVAFAAVTALLLVAVPRPLVAIFLDVSAPSNREVVALATSFLSVAALFQLVDSGQAIGAGVLRGLHDTRIPMLFAATGYWIIGIGVGAFLAFRTELAGIGIWLGLATGLAVVAVLMIARWSLRERLHLST
ncbi:MAG TPA: MATE family efflux transporter [Sphingobium sp.]|uniref:MATE family efflux transporter n=1 Tax=Sphingobium sp. TaxID=1912891 RepID=UPI002ED232D4